MKKGTVFISGGLGNQMFEYAFLLYLKRYSKLDNLKINTAFYIFCKDHNGYELFRLFNISQNKNILEFYLLRLSRFLYNRRGLIRKMPYMRYICEKNFSSSEIQSDSDIIYFFDGYWQELDFVEKVKKEIFNTFRFDKSKLNVETEKLYNKISNLENTVSIHVRRGDYCKFDDKYGNICTLEYYKQAIEIINQKISDPLFICFSDDMEWVRANIQLENAIYVDWNIGENSWEDMFLMSNCRNSIIANSTFSWWGAYLKENIKDSVIICPHRFTNQSDDWALIPEGWIKL
ncbi:MAG: alpha-1,2-fucosyltransferase [Muribaculaceae bacterium]|nr:alpha-1,2-fucosyltransferase [Muribaculaceae bacterium]